MKQMKISSASRLCIEQAGPFLRQPFQMPDHSLTARQLVYLWQGLQTVACATVTEKGEPRVAPIGALFFRGQLYIPTVANAVRTRQVIHHPSISLTYFQGDEVAIIVHGDASVLGPDHADFAAVEAFQHERSGNRVGEWGEGVFLRVTPTRLYTFARSPEDYSEG
ncbi:MAG: hypothetical protein NVS3B14_22120 [Ktedonobacteraceae bacterium]